MKKSILETIHSSVEELHEIDLVDEVTMREFDAMCLPPIKEYSAIEIRRIRKRNNVSQTVFARYLNTSPSTVRQWEQGVKNPQAMALKLLSLVDHKGLEVLA